MELNALNQVLDEVTKCQERGIHPLHRKLRDAGLLSGYRDRDKHRIRVIRRLLQDLHPHPITSVVYDIFNDMSGDGHTSQSNYKFVNRYLKTNPRYFEVRDVEGGVREVYGKKELIDLILDGITQKSGGTVSGFNRSNAQNLISKYTELTDPGRRILAEELSSYVERIDNYRLWFEAEYLDIRDSGPDSEIFRIPYATRFNSKKRTAKSFAQFNQALEFAREEYSNAVFMTLTTDPKQHESISDMADSISRNWNRLRSWMRYDSQNPNRPNQDFEYIKTLEFSEKGYPHLHVLAFDVETRGGKPYLIEKGLLSDRWDDLGQGEIVDLQSLVYESDLGDGYEVEEGFIAYSEAESGKSTGSGGSEDDSEIQSQTVGQYLGKYMSKTLGAIDKIPTWSSDSSEEEDSDSEDSGSEEDSDIGLSEIAKIGLYFSTQKKIFTKSQEIQEHISSYGDEETDDSDAETGKFVKIEFLGCYRIGDEPYRLSVESEPLSLAWLNKHKLSSSASAENSEGVPPPSEELSDFVPG